MKKTKTHSKSPQQRAVSLAQITRQRAAAEAEVQQLRRRETEIRAEQAVLQDPEARKLDAHVSKARRALQLNRMCQSQRRRSIRTMKQKIVDVEKSIEPLMQTEEQLKQAHLAAEEAVARHREVLIDRALEQLD